MARSVVFTCNQCNEQFKLYTGPFRSDDQTSWQVKAAERAEFFLDAVEKHNQKGECRDAYGHFSFHASDIAIID